MAARARKTDDVLTLALENRNPAIEQMLEQFNVPFEYLKDVPTTQIDVDRSLGNQARFEALNPETLAAYTKAANAGNVFPPVIAYRGSRGKAKKLTLVDGNHRAASHRAAGKPLDVYVLDSATPPEVIATLTMVSNTRNGLSFSDEERLDHAATLVEEHAFTVKNAADLYGISPETKLKNAMHKRAADRRSVDVGIDTRVWEGFPSSVRTRLAAISTNEIFKEAVQLAHDARLGGAHVNAFVTEMGRTKSLAKQRDILKQHRILHADRIQATLSGNTKKKGPQTSKHRISLAFSHLLTLPDNVELIARTYGNPDERDETADQIEKVLQTLTGLLGALRT